MAGRGRIKGVNQMFNLEKNLANILTLLNLCCGFIALRLILVGRYTGAALMILVAVVLDCVDGKVARRFGAASEIGKRLDPLCAMVSFGVVPATLAGVLAITTPGWMMVVTGIIYTLASAYRMASYDSLGTPEGIVLGFPSTLCGAIIALLGIIAQRKMPAGIWALLLLVLSALMLSRLRLPKLPELHLPKNTGTKRNRRQ